MTLLLILVAGGIGAAVRFVLDSAARGRWGLVLPWSTIAVNLSGSALIGVLTGARMHHGLDLTPYLVLAVGFCGGYTTFSTAMVETVRLVQTGRPVAALLNAVGSMVLATAAAAAGFGLLWLLR